MSIVFHVSKPIDPQYKSIDIKLEVSRAITGGKYRWTIRYCRREGDLTEISEDEVGDKEQVYLKAIIKCFRHFQGSHRPLIIFTDNVYLKTCVKEWLERWSKNNFENCLSSNKELLKELYECKNGIKLENIILEHSSRE